MLLCGLLNISAEEVGFWCVNPRQKKIKKLNISFESEVYNIYDPSFTSEEELDDIDIESVNKNN